MKKNGIIFAAVIAIIFMIVFWFNFEKAQKRISLDKKIKELSLIQHPKTSQDVANTKQLNEINNKFGIMARDGQGVPQDYKEAIIWFSKAADQGYADAQFNLGTMYDKGQGIKKNKYRACNLIYSAAIQGHTRALDWFYLNAAKGNISAQRRLAYMYYHGEGVGKNSEIAATWYLKAAEQGDAISQFNLVFLYDNGHGVKANEQDAIKWLKKAATQGHAVAQAELYLRDLAKKKKTMGVKFTYENFLNEAKRGNISAQYKLGQIYRHSQGEFNDPQKALYWFLKAAEQSSAPAAMALSNIYDEIDTLDKHEELSLKWLIKAAEGGMLNAQLRLSTYYQGGEGRPRKYDKALMWQNILTASGDIILVETAKVYKNVYLQHLTKNQIKQVNILSHEWLKSHQYPHE